MDQNDDKRVRGKGDQGRVVKVSAKRSYSKRRVAWNKKQKQKGKVNESSVSLEDSLSSVVDTVASSSSTDNSIAPAAQDHQQAPEPVPSTSTIVSGDTDIDFSSVPVAPAPSCSTMANIAAEKQPEKVNSPVPASVQKVVDIPEENLLSLSGFRLIDMDLLNGVFNLLACPECYGIKTLTLKDIYEKKRGLSCFLQINCSNCPYSINFNTSKDIESLSNDSGAKKDGRKHSEINVRMVYGMRVVGAGHSQLEKLCSMLNMPRPMNKSSYDKSVESLNSVVKSVAEKSMDDAADELRKISTDCAIGIDGSWQRKGYSSNNGFVAGLSVETGKVLDCIIMSKSCKGCHQKEVLRTSQNKVDQKIYRLWKADHSMSCSMNYVGSSPNMEKVGALKIYENSLAKKLYYTSFYGDGDSKSYSAVKEFYGPKKPVKKFECIGHYQKRIGSRLRKLRKENNLGGRGRLTGNTIDVLQNYFGIALRQNVSDLDAMIKATMASFYHVAGCHDKCPKTSDSWCQYQLDQRNFTKKYKEKLLPLDVRKHILPVYNDLCRPEMLEKCLHGKTQNPNESFNGTVWNRIPKANHVGLTCFKLGVYDAISHFNYGEKATLDILRGMGIQPGFYTSIGCRRINIKRKRSAVYRSSDVVKKTRQVSRLKKNTKEEDFIGEEGQTYGYGEF